MDKEEQENISVLLVDDHRLMVEGLAQFVQETPDMRLIGYARNRQELNRILENVGVPEVLVLDIRLEKDEPLGITIAEEIREQYPSVKILALSMFADGNYINAMIEQGCMGYLLKDSSKDNFLTAIRTAAQGKQFLDPRVQEIWMNYVHEQKKNSQNIPALTKREKEILPYIIHGASAREIAAYCNISTTTVETHRRNMIEKYNVRNTADLIRFVIKHALVNPDDSPMD